MVVTARVDYDSGGDAKGGIYVFTRPAGGWVDTSVACTLNIPDSEPDVAISGQTFVCGASPSGAAENVYLFQAPAQWTYLEYIDGQHGPADTPLETHLLQDFLQIAGVGSTADVNLVVEFARAGDDPHYDGWIGVREGIVEPGDTPDINWGSRVGRNVDMGATATLADFVTWAEASFPASNYALVLNDHGGGYEGACEGPTGDMITPAQVTVALGGASAQKLALIGFDACLMQMTEVAYQLRNYAEIMVGSEANIPLTSWDYTPFLQELTADPSLTPTELGQSIVSAYAAFYGSASSATLSCVDLTHLADLAGEIDNFATLMLNSATPGDWVRVGNAIFQSQVYLDVTVNSVFGDYVDLGDMMTRIKSAGVAANIASEAALVGTRLSGAVIQSYAGSPFPNSYGLTLYSPSFRESVATDYTANELAFVNDTHWLQFLEILTTRPFVASISPTTGSTDGETVVTITGANFLTLTAVFFGSLPGTVVQSYTPTQIVVSSPSETAGTVDVLVETTSGGTSTAWSGDQFVYKSAVSPPAKLGIFSGGYWYRDTNGDGTWDAGDGSPLTLGWNGAIPVVGDWDGSGKTEIGVFSNGTWWLDTSTGVQTFTFGFGGSNVFPVVGDWNGDGKTDVGVYCNGAWFRDVDGSRTWDATNQAAVAYLGWNDGGTNSVIPVPGRWAGNGKTEMGVYCNGVWFLDSTGDNQYDNSYSYWGWYSPGSPLVPVAGDWSGNGAKDQFAVYNQGVWFRDADGTHQWDSTNQAALAYFGWSGAARGRRLVQLRDERPAGSPRRQGDFIRRRDWRAGRSCQCRVNRPAISAAYGGRRGPVVPSRGRSIDTPGGRLAASRCVRSLDPRRRQPSGACFGRRRRCDGRSVPCQRRDPRLGVQAGKTVISLRISDFRHARQFPMRQSLCGSNAFLAMKQRQSEPSYLASSNEMLFISGFDSQMIL